MADIDHEIKINAAPEAIYQALTNASELAKWHTASTNGKGETFTTHPNDGPSFEWKVLEPDRQSIEWQCIGGPGHSVGTIARFKLSPGDGGRTLVELSHSGWHDTTENFRKCNTLWAILLFHLKKYLEAGEAGPAFS
ncbi:MAG: SRPBCC domain-containing protein [Edaphobacter sp.]|uniref:SRPBCC family protein n=1 Tax=Edaphobacter sp. TaxID=1934404 RepID=UPI0023942331|nr:SRPBCC domain-containing protein [Edaphobacter sp.]MDE1175927.1 SRPBCC domain-containing protein [Edaphobacter sp.]